MDITKKHQNLILALLYIVVMILSAAAISAVAGLGYGLYCLDRDTNQIPAWLTIKVCYYAAYPAAAILFLVLFLAHTKRYKTELRNAIHIKKKHWLLYAFLFGILVKMSEYALITNISATYFYAPLNNTLTEVLEEFLYPDHMIAFICTCFFAPPVEEVLCRFFFPLHFSQAFPRPAALFFSSLIFAAMHATAPLLLLLLYFADGCLLHLVYSRTGSIQCAILMHSGLNFYTAVVKLAQFHYFNVSIPFFIVTACLVLVIVCTLVRRPLLLAQNNET